jgi:hypothetical protein
MERIPALILVSLCSAAVAGFGCGHRCEPALCIDDTCVVRDVEVPAAGGSPSLTEGQVVTVRYVLPAGVSPHGTVSLRVETPCACAEFTRGPAANTGNAAGAVAAAFQAVDDACEPGADVTIPLTVPQGGQCSMSITASIENDSRTLTIVPAAPCAPLDCTSDVACTQGLPAQGAGGA